MSETTLNITFDPKYESYLRQLYTDKLENNTQYLSDVGFDLFLPEDITIGPKETVFINLGVKAEYRNKDHFLGYHLYPRSSISKTKIRLANSVGIIDPNYRGNIIAAVDNMSDTEQKLKKGEKYFQLVFVQMTYPGAINIVEQLTETDRGSNGFGSTK